jgi:hypothetical protein
LPCGRVVARRKHPLDVTRDRLTKGEGIPAERLITASAAPAAAPSSSDGVGRVEFEIREAEE